MDLIWGMGREGNSTYNYLRRYTDEKLYIADDKEIDLKNYTNVEQVSKIDFSKYEKIYKSPGITTYNMDFDKSKLTSQTEVFFQKYKSQIIGVTGTKGKSTTSSLIYHILKGITDNVVLVGNIGLPCLDFIDEIDDKTIIVFELSCHQLEYVTASPHIAVLLNTYQDHLDHYGTYENYVSAKHNIFKYQNKQDVILTPNDIKSKSKIVDFSQFISENVITTPQGKITVNKDDTLLVGEHNLKNIAVAYYICHDLYGVSDQIFMNRLKTFKGLPHRLEFVCTIDGISYYDDSISTTCQSCISGIKSFNNVGTILIGGLDRGIDYTPLVEYLQDAQVDNIILFSQTANRIKSMLTNKDNVFVVDTLLSACNLAKKITAKNKVCLLSPAAASYCDFKNFEERGEKFKEYIKQN